MAEPARSLAIGTQFLYALLLLALLYSQAAEKSSSSLILEFTTGGAGPLRMKLWRSWAAAGPEAGLSMVRLARS